MKDALKELNIVYDEVDKVYTITENNVDTSYDCLKDAVWNGIFGFCTCGDLDAQLIKMYNLLSSMDDEFPNEPAPEDVIYLYLLDSKRMTEHGCSVHFSWLNERGRALMKVIKAVVRTRFNKEKQYGTGGD